LPAPALLVFLSAGALLHLSSGYRPPLLRPPRLLAH
jgi:hypothetical protein